jgi:hypothetical protein
VYGQSDSNIGLVGYSANGVGGDLTTDSAAQPAVAAENTAVAANPAAIGLLVQGDCITMNAVLPKSAAVPTSRGLRRLYVVEAPEAMFEDVNKITLSRGQARVELDPIFADTIETRDYQVFLTPRGDCKGVHVAERRDGWFLIRENDNGTSGVIVNYRIVAPRKGFRPNMRFETFTPPEPPRKPVPKPPKRPRFERPRLSDGDDRPRNRREQGAQR